MNAILFLAAIFPGAEPPPIRSNEPPSIKGFTELEDKVRDLEKQLSDLQRKAKGCDCGVGCKCLPGACPLGCPVAVKPNTISTNEWRTDYLPGLAPGTKWKYASPGEAGVQTEAVRSPQPTAIPRPQMGGTPTPFQPGETVTNARNVAAPSIGYTSPTATGRTATGVTRAATYGPTNPFGGPNGCPPSG